MHDKVEYTRDSQRLLELKHVSLAFGSNLILRDVNATITHIQRKGVGGTGQVICFLGPSGMGKTQLARIICGLQLPTSGEVVLDGDVPTHKGLVGLVPQNYSLFKYLTVEQNLVLAAKQGGARSNVSVYVEMLGLKEHLHKYPKALSGGTKQRVAIARQLLCCKHYLVMDEPFSGLDPIMKGKASEAITRLAQADDLNTIILITHDISEGLAAADMVWLLGLEPSNSGGYLQGARLVEQYDLADMGFAWHPDIQSDTEFQKFVAEVKGRFRSLR